MFLTSLTGEHISFLQHSLSRTQFHQGWAFPPRHSFQIVSWIPWMKSDVNVDLIHEMLRLPVSRITFLAWQQSQTFSLSNKLYTHPSFIPTHCGLVNQAWKRIPRRSVYYHPNNQNIGYTLTTQFLMSEMKKSNASMHAANSKCKYRDREIQNRQIKSKCNKQEDFMIYMQHCSRVMDYKWQLRMVRSVIPICTFSEEISWKRQLHP